MLNIEDNVQFKFGGEVALIVKFLRKIAEFWPTFEKYTPLWKKILKIFAWKSNWKSQHMIVGLNFSRISFWINNKCIMDDMTKE